MDLKHIASLNLLTLEPLPACRAATSRVPPVPWSWSPSRGFLDTFLRGAEAVLKDLELTGTLASMLLIYVRGSSGAGDEALLEQRSP